MMKQLDYGKIEIKNTLQITKRGDLDQETLFPHQAIFNAL